MNIISEKRMKIFFRKTFLFYYHEKKDMLLTEERIRSFFKSQPESFKSENAVILVVVVAVVRVVDFTNGAHARNSVRWTSPQVPGGFFDRLQTTPVRRKQD